MPRKHSFKQTDQEEIPQVFKFVKWNVHSCISAKGWIINILSIASHEVSFLTTHLSYCNIKSIVRSKVTLTIPAFVCESQHKLLESPVMKVGHNTLILARHGSLHLWFQHLAGRAKEIGSSRQASVLSWRRQAWNIWDCIRNIKTKPVG